MTIVMGNDQLAAEPGFIGMAGKIKFGEHISEVPYPSALVHGNYRSDVFNWRTLGRYSESSLVFFPPNEL